MFLKIHVTDIILKCFILPIVVLAICTGFLPMDMTEFVKAIHNQFSMFSLSKLKEVSIWDTSHTISSEKLSVCFHYNSVGLETKSHHNIIEESSHIV